MRTIGARLGQVSEGYCEIEVPFSPQVTQHHGLFHGGVVASIADTAAGFAAYTLMEEGRQPLTVEFKISLLSPADGERIVAKARTLRAGRSIVHLQSEVFCQNEGTETCCAVALVTIKATRAVQEI